MSRMTRDRGAPVDPKLRHEGAPSEAWTPRLVLSLASILLILEVLNASYMMVALALPTISLYYGTSQGAWLLTAFLVVGSITPPLLGKLADIHGKRKVMMACLVLSTIGSAISAVAPTFGIMLVGRALGGLLVPVLFLAYSLIRDVFPPSKVALSVSIATTGAGLIIIVAPFLAGWLISEWGFRSLFWFMVIIVGVLSPVVWITTPESPFRARARTDWLGASLLGGGLASVLIALSMGPVRGWTSIGTMWFLFGGLAALTVWVVTALKANDPLIDLRVVRRRSISMNMAAAGATYGCSTAFVMLLPIMLMTPAALGLGYGFGLDVESVAIFQAPVGLFTMVGGLVVGLSIQRIRPRTMIAIGNTLMAAGFTCTALWHTDKALLLLFVSIFGFGMGLCYAAVPNIIIAAVPPELQATTSGAVAVAQSGAAAILPVVVGAVLNSNVAVSGGGGTYYSGEGITAAFMVGTVTGLIGLVVSLSIPRKIKRYGSERADC